jgi:hypothetical protein
MKNSKSADGEQKPEAVARPVEEWARDKSTPDWVLVAARVMNGWPIGRLLTEQQFDDGLTNQPTAR